MTGKLPGDAPAEGSDLSRLLALEAQLDADLAAARAQAEQTVAEARQQAATRATAVDAEVEAAGLVLEGAITIESERGVAACLAEGRARAGALDAIDPARFDAVVEAVVTAALAEWAA